MNSRLLLLSFLFFSFVGCERPTTSEVNSSKTNQKSAQENNPVKAKPAPKREKKKEPLVVKVPELSPEMKEKIVTAKKFASELGIAMKENAAGQVISFDTAANRSWVDDFQMMEVLIFPSLETLVLEGPNITDQLVPQLAKLTSLTSLTLRNTLVSDAGLAQLSSLKKLKIIDLRLSPLVSDAGMSALAKMDHLRAVRVSGCNLNDTGIRTLLGLSKLSELDVRNCRGITEAGIKAISEKNTIRTLKIGGEGIADPTISLIASMKELKGLSLDHCDFSDKATNQLDALSLTDLTLYQTPKVTDQGLQFLKQYDQLKKLTLRDIGANGSSLALLPKPENLLSLNLAQSQLNDSEIKFLSRFSNLTTLILNETSITDSAIETLKQLKKLKRIEMTQTSITQAGADQLQKALPGCLIRIN